MESANTHHHLQDQLVGSSSSSSSSSSLPTIINPSLYGLGFTSTHTSWPPSPFLNSNCLSSYPIETKQQQEINQTSQLYSNSMSMSMATDLSFNYGNSEKEESRIKEELAEHYYRKYSEILSSSHSPANEDDNHNLLVRNDVATKLLLRSLSSYGKNIPDFYSNSRGFAQIFSDPTTAAVSPGSLDMNLEALDLLASSRFSGNLLGSSHNQIGILRDGFSSNYAFDQIPFYGSNKVSSASSNNVVAQSQAEAKRNSNNKMETKSLIQKPPKKSRLEARSSCPPFKVRKEKLGDRIAALQQLVAPFGKSDTASVLMEAIGYIKFLQSQVETLSVPYMKASRNKPNRVTKGGLVENENEETKRDLKSRGLCLVPLSCLSYIADGGGATVWPPPHLGGAT